MADSDRPVGVDRGDEPIGQRGQPFGRRLTGNAGGEFEDRRRRIRPAVGDAADVLDRHAVDRPDLLDQQLLGRRVRERHDQFIDDPTGAALEDVDGDDVAADGADPARHLTQRTRAVRQPHADDQGAGHSRTVLT